MGWWWIVGPSWYFYPAPVYPFPDPYTPPTVVVQTVPASGPHYWYCTNPQGYYPYVPLCYDAWRRVEAAPSTTTIIETTTPQTVVQAPMVPAEPAVPAAPATPDQGDYQKLNAYSAELAAISASDKDAPYKLRKLAERVETFRKSLLKRDYNAMNILRDTEDLKDRIAEQRENVRKAQRN